MPEPIDLIEALRQYQRLSGNTNPFVERAPELAGAPPIIPRAGLEQTYAPQDTPAQAQMVGPQMPDDYSDQLMRRYMNQLDTMPVRNKPNIGQKIFAGIAAIKDPEAANQILYGKYNRQLADWATKTKAIGDVAQQERLYKVNQRQAKAAEDLSKYREGMLGVAETKAKTAQDRLEFYKYKFNNPNSIQKVDDQGYMIGINPQTNEAHYILDTDGNPVHSGSLSDTEKLGLQHANAMELQNAKASATQDLEKARQANRETNIGLQGQNQINLEGAKQENRETNIGLQGEQARATRATPTGNQRLQSTKTETPSQKATRWRNNANAFKVEHPELAKYVIIDGNNVTLTAPSSFLGVKTGPSQKDYDLMKSQIYDLEAQESQQANAPTSETLGKQEKIPEEPTVTSQEPKPKTTTRKKIKVDPKIKAEKMKGLKPGNVLVSNGTSFGQVPATQIDGLKEPGWFEVE